MGLLVYKFSDYEHTAEREQYRTLCNQLKAYYSNRDEICIFVANYNIYDCELDGILIKQDAIMCVEFKNYGGTVTAVENGNWTLSDGTIIGGGSRKTVYQQANLNHIAIKRGFKEGLILPGNSLKNVAALVVFHQPIELNNKLSVKTQSWLHVCDERTFMEKVQDITSKHTDISKTEMMALVSKMALAEEYLDEKYSNVEILHPNTLTNETEYIEDNRSNANKQHETISNVKALDGERLELFNFVSHIIDTLCINKHCNINIFNSIDAFSLFEPYGITLTKTYLITVEAEGIGKFCPKISKFINHPVRAINSGLIFWEEGLEIVELQKETEEENSKRPSTSLNRSNNSAKTLFRKSKTVLPHWLDIYIFNTLAAQYAPEHERYEYNLDLNEDETRVYLGTYFPRSYAEAFCIYDNLLGHISFKQELEKTNTINILDIGCGTGGELFGILTALTKHVETSKNINISACDGNDIALSILCKICQIAQKRTHHNINLSIHNKTYALKTKIETKDINDKQYDIILCNKFVCELMSHNIMVDKAYYNVAKSLAPVLKENGILIMLDVTTKDNHSGLYYPQLMNIELNKFTKENSDIKTLLPLSCGKFDACEHACFMQQTFYISHSHKSNDESRVCYRVLCKDTLKSRISLPKSEDTCFIIHPIKHEQGDSAAMCKYSIGNNIIDSFNINN